VNEFEKNYVICMKSSDDRETLDKSKIKILKSKGPKMELWGTLERATWGKEKRGKELYIKTCCDNL